MDDILQPTYHGYIGNTEDAVLVMQAVLDKKLPAISRRVNPTERSEVILLGNVFVFLEDSSNIKRWTDGITWSASRILGRFLVYREVDKDNLVDKSLRGKRKKRSASVVADEAATSTETDSLMSSSRSEVKMARRASEMGLRRGSEIMDYRSGYIPWPPKHDPGLNKKTISFTVIDDDEDGKETKRTIHLISYFAPQDIVNQTLVRPSASVLAESSVSPLLRTAVDKSLQNMKPSPVDQENFFLDSKYQLLKFSTASRRLPIMRYDLAGADSQTSSDNAAAETKHEASSSEAPPKLEHFPPIAPARMQGTQFVNPFNSIPGLNGISTLSGQTAEPGSGGGVGSGSSTNSAYIHSQEYRPRPQINLSKPPVSNRSVAPPTQAPPAPKLSNENRPPVLSLEKPSISILAGKTQPAMPVPILKQGVVVPQRIYTLPLFLFGEQPSPQPTLPSNFQNAFHHTTLQSGFPSPYQTSFGGRVDLDPQLLAQLRRYYPDYHMPNIHAPNVPVNPTYAFGYDQPFSTGNGVFHSFTHEQSDHFQEPMQRPDMMLAFNSRIESPLGFEFPAYLHRPRSKQEDMEASHGFEENFH